jgi:class 3 adenylate cyclase/predicted ATPase
MDVAEWLRGLGLEQYATAFRENDIGERVLPSLTADDLKELGVNLIGHRRLMLDGIAALRDTMPDRTTQDSPSGTPLSAHSAEAERRQLTVMFCDIVGSTALSTQLDPEDLRDLISAYHRTVADTVTRFDGFVAKYMGDGILIYFGYPQAHEDDAERSVRAGLAVIEDVAKVSGRVTLRVRIGIATGLAVVGDLIGVGAAQERGVVGETPNLAARVQGLAEPNTIVIADGTRRQVGGLFDFAELGSQTLAGFAEPQHAWRVIGESEVLSRFEALRSGSVPLVGRDEECELLMRRWARVKSGEGQVVLVSGEPGIGKSRLTATVLERLGHEPNTRLRYFCSPHFRDSALWPVIAQIERAAGFERGDAEAVKLEKLRSLTAPATQDAIDFALLSELLSLPGAADALNLSLARKREKLFDAVLGLLEAEARKRPVLMVFEDAHWIDPTSRELLDLTIDRIRQLPVLLLITFRPEFESHWGGRAHVSSLVLNRLGERDGETMVRTLAGNAGLSPETVAEIVGRTDGVPLFVEELTKAVLESAGQSQTVLMSVPAAAHAVPATLHAALMARLDRLGPTAKEIAEIGAVLGREFGYELIEAVARRPQTELLTAMGQLGDAQLLFCRGTPPLASYMFKHALVQDAAYGTLLRGRRQEFHSRAAAVLERQFADLVERQPELLAHHHSGAGETEAAVAQWLKAGQRSAARSAHAEAIVYIGQGLTLLGTLPETPERDDRELELVFARAGSIMATKGFAAPELLDAYSRARDLAERRHDANNQFAALWGLHISRIQGLHFEEAHRLSDKLLILTRDSDDDGLRLQAHHAAWSTYLWSGKPALALRHAEAGQRLYDCERHRAHALTYGGHDPGACACQTVGFAGWLNGYPDRSRANYDAAVRTAEQLGHPASIMIAHSFAAMGSQFRRDPEASLRHIAAAETVATEQRLMLQFDARVLRGGATMVLGAAQEAAAGIRDGLAARAAGTKLLRPYSLGLLCDALRMAGNIDGALKAVTEGLATIEATGERWWEAELQRLRGILLLARRDVSGAEATLRQAIDLARSQQAKSLELRAATSLARLCGEQGRRGEGSDLLSPIYGWFTEGFDTADLEEAKALLEELA